jgi:polyhydroxyalkanoate synthesis regulator phasin
MPRITHKRKTTMKGGTISSTKPKPPRQSLLSKVFLGIKPKHTSEKKINQSVNMTTESDMSNGNSSHSIHSGNEKQSPQLPTSLLQLYSTHTGERNNNFGKNHTLATTDEKLQKLTDDMFKKKLKNFKDKKELLDLMYKEKEKKSKIPLINKEQNTNLLSNNEQFYINNLDKLVQSLNDNLHIFIKRWKPSIELVENSGLLPKHKHSQSRS